MIEFYELVCNYGHPNYNAHSLVGTIEDDRVFRLSSQKNYKKIKKKDFNMYKPAWNTTLMMIPFLYSEIANHPLVKKFRNVRSQKYFI